MAAGDFTRSDVGDITRSDVGDILGMDVVTSKYVPRDWIYFLDAKHLWQFKPRDVTDYGPTNLPTITTGGTEPYKANIIGDWQYYEKQFEAAQRKAKEEAELQAKRDQYQAILEAMRSAEAAGYLPGEFVGNNEPRAKKAKKTAAPAEKLSKHGRVILPEDPE